MVRFIFETKYPKIGIICRYINLKNDLMDKIKIIEAGNEIGLGGTEYVIQLYSKYLDKEHFEVLVIGVHKGGERVKLIEDLGIEVAILNSDMTLLAKLLKETDVFHWHGDGTLNPAIFDVVKANRPRMVIQTNVFGAYHPSPLYDTIDYDLYVSKMILIRRMYTDQNQENSYYSKRKALHNPIDTDHINSLMPSNNQLQQFKKENDLLDYFIIGRIGRADEGKFDFITLDGFAEFAKSIPNARFLLVGATLSMVKYAEALGITNKLIVFENTPDLKQLLFYYRSMEILLAASRIGESFGMVIAEAMTAGTPVLTISTPYADNAQVEIVDNGKTGLVVERSIEKIAAALQYLYHQENVRVSLSIAAKQKVENEYKANRIVKSLEELIYHHFQRPIPYQEKSLLTDFSQEIINDYIYRCSDLWEPTETKINEHK